MNTSPLHIDENYMLKHKHGKILVCGPLVMSLIVGMSVSDTSGKAVANLEYESVKHLGPVFIGDTSVHEYPSSEQLAEIAISSARVVRLFGFDPKVAFLSHSTFGQPLTSRTKHIRDAVSILKKRKVDFKFDGDMQPDVALSNEYSDLYPFSEIVGNANILIMPGQHSAAISYKIMKTLGGAKVIGPLLIGLGQAIEIAPLRSSTSDILNLASIAAYSAGVINYKK